MKNTRSGIIIGILLLLLGAPTGYLLSELTRQKIARLQEVGTATSIDTLTLQALLAMDIGSFFSLLGLIVVSVNLARCIRNKFLIIVSKV